MNFDFEITKEDGAIKYGIVTGNDRIVFIKAGAGGSHTGYENKYVRMARALNEREGATVICAANPSDELSRYDKDVIRSIISEKRAPVLSFIGVSRGAYLGLIHISEHFEFEKLLFINMPLMINFHKAMKMLKNKNATFVYGSRDPSEPYIPFLKKYCDKVTVIKGADHQFREMTKEFVDLVRLI